MHHKFILSNVPLTSMRLRHFILALTETLLSTLNFQPFTKALTLTVCEQPLRHTCFTRCKGHERLENNTKNTIKLEVK